jgi:hypothetical protein
MCQPNLRPRPRHHSTRLRHRPCLSLLNGHACATLTSPAIIRHHPSPLHLPTSLSSPSRSSHSNLTHCYQCLSNLAVVYSFLGHTIVPIANVNLRTHQSNSRELIRERLSCKTIMTVEINNDDLILYGKYARALQRVQRKILHLLIFATNSCV